jgi:hypothetical protein
MEAQGLTPRERKTVSSCTGNHKNVTVVSGIRRELDDVNRIVKECFFLAWQRATGQLRSMSGVSLSILHHCTSLYDSVLLLQDHVSLCRESQQKDATRLLSLFLHQSPAV